MKYTHKQLRNIVRHKLLFKPNARFNHIDYDFSTSEEHNKEMFHQFFELRKWGSFLAVNQKLENGKRPDIAILDLPELMIKEVMISETDKRCDKKEYPGRIIKVRGKR